MDVALIRGPHLRANGVIPWDYLDATTDEISVTAFESDPARFDTSTLQMEVRSLPWLDGAFDVAGRDHLLWDLLSRYKLPRGILRGVGSLATEFDVLHTSENFNLFSLQAALAARGTDTTFVFSAGENIPYWPDNSLTWAVKRFVNRQAAGVTTTTMQGKQALIHEGISHGDIDIVPNALSFDHFDSGPKRVDGTPLPNACEETFNILFIHGLRQQKGVEYLLDGFEAFGEDIPDATLILVGENDLPAAYYESRIAADESVHHVRHVPNREIHRLYNLADVSVLPSVTVRNNEEQFGMTVLEAMACGVPTVVTNVGGLPHVVEDGATSIVVEERSAAALRDAFVDLYHDVALREALGETAYDYVRERYAPSVVAEELAAFYREVVET